MLNRNRQKTLTSIHAAMEELSVNEEFTKLPYDRQLQLAMQFYQCERARLQKAKMLVEFLLKDIAPIGVSLYALWIALHK
ncbi:MAG TPA: hypothetical protein VEA59_02100 [Patescibacteria group bacterium]|nr:hypothetical protein [Patescibacteria group bacterium]